MAAMLPSALRQFFKAAKEYVLMLGGYLIFGGLGLPFNVLCTLLHPFLPRDRAVRFVQSSLRGMFSFFLRYVTRAGILELDFDELKKLQGRRGVIIAPNHPCLLDAVFMMSQAPEVVCITAAKVWYNPFLGGAARLARYLRNDTPRGLIEEATQRLKDGENLLVFPEGTRTVQPGVNHFKGGFAMVAKLSGAPIQTVFIEASSRYLGKRWPLWRRPPFPARYSIRLGDQFRVAPDANVKSFVAELEDYYRKQLASPPRRSDPVAPAAVSA
jgi:1-acyl-sn-glycerol-3-phosphate acyltransferase